MKPKSNNTICSRCAVFVIAAGGRTAKPIKMGCVYGYVYGRTSGGQRSIINCFGSQNVWSSRYIIPLKTVRAGVVQTKQCISIIKLYFSY